MAETAHKTDEEKKEFFDSPEILDQKITKLAELVLKSKHFIAFTGAGISTSAGIPDYRSGANTVLPTGAGCWEKKAQKIKQTNKNPLRVSMLQAVPTKTHMALLTLEQKGYLKHLISQNTDGLHRRSGFPSDKLSEVHGNTNLEICRNKNCKRQYLRDFKCRNAQKTHDHKTGRKCVFCGEPLYDSIINFGENLPEKVLDMGFEQSKKADLCLAMGSSLRVTPAADMPQEVGNSGDLVIVNLQKTPLDKYASLRIFALCDQVMELLFQKLELAIPQFRLERRFQVIRDNNSSFKVQGVDKDGLPHSLFKSVKFQANKDTSSSSSKVVAKEPFVFTSQKGGTLNVDLEFQGHYGEKQLRVQINMDKFANCQTFGISLDPKSENKEWTIQQLD